MLVSFGCGRNVRKLVEVSEATGVPIVVPTGFQKSSYYLPDHWQHRYDEATVAELLIAECRGGVDENNYDGPVVRRSPVKAGLIKVAGDYGFVSPTTRKLIRAAGRAHRATGTPALVHTEMGTAGGELLELLEAAGVSTPAARRARSGPAWPRPAWSRRSGSRAPCPLEGRAQRRRPGS